MGLKLLSFLDLRDSCIKLEIPMLHCFGKYDRLVPTEDLVKYWYDNPQAKTKVFTKTSHNPFLSESSDFIETVKSFINSVSN
jgi:pimeloyl-[acyl-carrier protein] methyl ester esterase